MGCHSRCTCLIFSNPQGETKPYNDNGSGGRWRGAKGCLDGAGSPIGELLTMFDDSALKPMLRGTNLTRSFGQGKTAMLALDGVSIELSAGEMVLLMGP